MQGVLFLLLLGLCLTAHGWAGAATTGDPEEGARVYRTCIACHSLEPGAHRTGPSLADLMGREAGTAEGFDRYSPALRSADLVWNEGTLGAWLEDPKALIPGNRMNFPGIPDQEARTDLIAYLELATAGAAEPPTGDGMMGAQEPVDLKQDVGPNNRVAAIRHCRDTYAVEVESGDAHQFWEYNLRFKTDSSERGPKAGRPVLVPAGMMGDRAFVIFAAPDEISPFIEARC